MRPQQIEAWVLSIVDRIATQQPVEDAMVELKSEWPQPQEAARRIAGHCNAARGAPVLWIIGLDERRGVVGAGRKELANWWLAVQSAFDGVSPSMRDLAVPVTDQTLVALLFESDRVPFVVKNPHGGSIQREVPWREGTGVRSAKREELLRIVVPAQLVPTTEVLEASLDIVEAVPGRHWDWLFSAHVYFTPATRDRVVIPFHRSIAAIQWAESERIVLAVGGSPEQIAVMGGESIVLSKTIHATNRELIIDGPGAAEVNANVRFDASPPGLPNQLMCTLLLEPVNAPHALRVEFALKGKGKGAWVLA